MPRPRRSVYARRAPQGSFLLVSTDPAHSLADSLGDFQPPDNLKILEFNAQDALATFKARHRGKLAEIAARGTFLDEEDIRRILDLSLPGLDELLALLAICRLGGNPRPTTASWWIPPPRGTRCAS